MIRLILVILLRFVGIKGNTKVFRYFLKRYKTEIMNMYDSATFFKPGKSINKFQARKGFVKEIDFNTGKIKKKTNS